MKKRYTPKTFYEKFKSVNGGLGMEIEYSMFETVDSKIKYTCKHGEYKLLGWQMLKKRSYCCQKGYHEHRVPVMKKTILERKEEIENAWGVGFYNLENLRYADDRRKVILSCHAHGEFTQWVNHLTYQKVSNGCPSCSKETEFVRKQTQAIDNFHRNGNHPQFISKQETEWLDQLEITGRQVYLEDVQYKVDGYDADTNTVYLYHGKFWHGCPETYDSSTQHPILKIKMGELYEKTKNWEKKIEDAGYNLVTKWG